MRQGVGLTWLAVVWSLIWGVLLWSDKGYAQRQGGGRSHDSQGSSYGQGDSYSDKPSVPEPYGGQIYCPVTGTKLGLTQPPVPVQTAIGEQKPSFLGKLFGQKAKPGVVIYVCCPACVEKVQKNPDPYLQEVIADKGCFHFGYGKAPAKRPLRAGVDQDNPVPASVDRPPDQS
jgi:hypothetical protein